jgi:hypothetical protein
LNLVASLFRSRSRLEAENAALRHQLIVLQRKVHGRVEFTNSDRLFFIQLYCWFPSILNAVMIIRPETLVRWHRAGFRRYWRWKSRNPGGRPRIDAGLRALIRRMSIENWLWGAPRIYRELFKLGVAVAQSTVAKYMGQDRWQPLACNAPCGWRIHNYAAIGICATSPGRARHGAASAGLPGPIRLCEDLRIRHGQVGFAHAADQITDFCADLGSSRTA